MPRAITQTLDYQTLDPAGNTSFHPIAAQSALKYNDIGTKTTVVKRFNGEAYNATTNTNGIGDLDDPADDLLIATVSKNINRYDGASFGQPPLTAAISITSITVAVGGTGFGQSGTLAASLRIKKAPTVLSDGSIENFIDLNLADINTTVLGADTTTVLFSEPIFLRGDDELVIDGFNSGNHPAPTAGAVAEVYVIGERYIVGSKFV